MQGKDLESANCPLESSASLKHVQSLAGRCVWRRDAHNYGQRLRRWVDVTQTQTQDLFSVRTLGVDEISHLVRQSRAVVLRTLRTHPDRLPRPAKRVGRNYLWLPDEVESWLRAGRSSIIQTGPDTLTAGQQRRGRGRPRKELRQGGEK